MRRGPPFTFQQMDALRPLRNRIPVDVYVSRDHAQARMAAAVAAGGNVVNYTRAPDWRTLADAEGNEVYLAIWGWAVSENCQAISGGLTRARRDDGKAGERD